jgi:hypothetical protein
MLMSLGKEMKNCKAMLMVVSGACALLSCAPAVRSQEKAPLATTDVHLVITDAALREDSEFPPLQKEDIKIKMGRTSSIPPPFFPLSAIAMLFSS